MKLLFTLLKLWWNFDPVLADVAIDSVRHVEEAYPNENSNFKRARAQKLILSLLSQTKETNSINLALELAVKELKNGR